MILKSFMYPPHNQFNFSHTHVTVVSIVVVPMFCYKNLFQYCWNMEQRNSNVTSMQIQNLSWIFRHRKFHLFFCISCLKKHDIYLVFSVWRNMTFILCFLFRKHNVDFLCLEICRAWLFPCPGNLLVSIVKKLMKSVMKHQVSILFLWELRSENTQFFIVV